LIDSCISKEVNEVVPYDVLIENTIGMIEPAPERNEASSIDEPEEDVAFQRKYLSMESSKAITNPNEIFNQSGHRMTSYYGIMEFILALLVLFE